MAFVFWDAKIVVLMDILPEASTIIGEYYANTSFGRLKIDIRDKRCGKPFYISSSEILSKDE